MSAARDDWSVTWVRQIIDARSSKKELALDVYNYKFGLFDLTSEIIF